MPRILILLALIVLLFPVAAAAGPSLGETVPDALTLEGAPSESAHDACIAVGPGYVIVRCVPVVVE